MRCAPPRAAAPVEDVARTGPAAGDDVAEVAVGHEEDRLFPCSSAQATTARAFELVQTAPPVRPASALTRPDVFM
jgi:hypothetical protein